MRDFGDSISNIPIVFEDDWLLILDKPSGLLTIPTPKKERRTLSGILNEALKNKNVSYRLHPCHRLDRETSGLIIYAKGKAVQKKMMDFFRQKKVKKVYTAFIQGNPPLSHGRVNYPIEGEQAITEYRILKKKHGFSIAEIMPFTGKTNQIRIHFKQMGYPILGETKYAFRRDFQLKAKRLCLHAAVLEFMHPVTRQYLRLSAELPQDMEKFLADHD